MYEQYDTYTIHLVNKLAQKMFWCFLAKPIELEGKEGVFANSSTSLVVDKTQPGDTSSFVIPVKYMVGANASTKAVGLGVRVSSGSFLEAKLGSIWDVDYADAPPKKGPKLGLTGNSGSQEAITLVADKFEKQKNEEYGWFSSMSFGIETDDGFTGMSWSPDPADKITLRPTLEFYISTGTFGENELADWTTVSNEAAILNVSTSFNTRKEATVILQSNGAWLVKPGQPTILDMQPQYSNQEINSLIESQHSLSIAQERLVEVIQSSIKGETSGGEKRVSLSSSSEPHYETVEDVEWVAIELADEATGWTNLQGLLSLVKYIPKTFIFSSFILSGTEFTVIKMGQDRGEWYFKYSGEKSADFIKTLFKKGAQIKCEDE